MIQQIGLIIYRCDLSAQFISCPTPAGCGPGVTSRALKQPFQVQSPRTYDRCSIPQTPDQNPDAWPPVCVYDHCILSGSGDRHWQPFDKRSPWEKQDSLNDCTIRLATAVICLTTAPKKKKLVKNRRNSLKLVTRPVVNSLFFPHTVTLNSRKTKWL